MSFEYEWTESNDVRLYWNGEELTTDPISNPSSGKRTRGDVPVGVREFVNDWLNERDIPQDVNTKDAVPMCIALEAGDFSER